MKDQETVQKFIAGFGLQFGKSDGKARRAGIL
jgi:alpha-D-ribose 1-methylphosphonate 5-triphosphate synthase subunit PhnI